MQLFTLDSSKIEVFETYFYDIVTIGYDHPTYVKHVLAVFKCFSPYLGMWVGGGGGVSQNMGTQPANAVVHPRQLKKSKFLKLVFLIL